MQRIAIIDIGSNSARLVISHIYQNGSYNMVYNQKETLRLAQKVNDKNQLTEEGFSSTLAIMHNFATMCKLYHVDQTIAVATAAIRNSENGQQLVDQVAAETGIHLQIIAGTTEAYVSFLGAINTINVKNGILFDLGGGSTELVLFKDRQIINSVSVPFGAVNTTNIFHTRDTLNPETYDKIHFFLTTQFSQYGWLKQKGLPLIGVGGTARTVAKIIERDKNYPTAKLHNFTYPLNVFRNFYLQLQNSDYASRKKISGLSSERNELILAGTSIIDCLLEVTGCKKIITSGCGVREGIFYDYYAKINNIPVISDDILRDSRENVLGQTDVNKEHAHHVHDMTMTMFKAWKELHQVPDTYAPLLETAALLHDIGITINYYSHARHSAYMIQNAKLFGLTHKEQLITSTIAGWHNGQSKSYFKEAIFAQMLNEEDWQIIAKLACLLGIAEALDDTETHQVVAITPSLKTKKDDCKAELLIKAVGPISVELQILNDRLNWFKKVFGVTLNYEVVTAARTRVPKELMK